MPLERALRVAIVGLGPKGLFALERLLDHARVLLPTERLAIDVFEPHAVPGAGPVYDPGQPAYLKMNFAADQLDMWWPGSAAVPPAYRRSFVEWRDALGIAAEAYPPRAQVGDYLAYGLDALLGSAPPSVGIRLHRARVETLRAEGDGWEVGAAGIAGHYDEVLIATGHQRRSEAALEHGWAHVAPLVPAVFPVDDAARPRARRARRDGRDPRLRADVHRRGARADRGPRRLVRAARRPPLPPALRARAGRGRHHHPVHPQRQADAREAGTDRRAATPRAARHRGGGTRPHRAARAADRSQARSQADPARDRGRVAARRRRPHAPRGHSTPPLRSSSRSRSRSAAAEPDAAWARGHVWRALYPAIVSQLGDQGLASADWPAFLRLAAERERVAFGPPAINAAKLLALIEARRIDLSHLQGARLADEAGRTRIRSEAGEQTVDVVIDAVLPGPGALGDRLLGELVASGEARIATDRRGLDVAADGSCRAADGSHRTRPLGRRAPERGLRDRQRHAQPQPAPPDRPVGAPRRRAPAAPRCERARAPARADARVSIRSGCAGVVPLTARLEPWHEALCEQPDLLAEWIEQLGSPLNVLDPGPLARNAAELASAADDAGVEFKAFFARKANKSLALVDAAHRHGLGIDVASERELRQVLERGVPASDVVVTAAVKPRSLLELCAATGATVVLDNEDELRLLAELGEGSPRVPVAFRLAPLLDHRPATRFGLAPAEILVLLERWWPPGGSTPLSISGRALPSRRLRGRRPRRRAQREPRARRRAGRARAPLGLHRHRRRHPHELPRRRGCMGALLERAPRGPARRGEPLTYEGHGLGLIAHAGEVLGRPNLYPYHQSPTRGAWLAQVLGATVSAGAAGHTVAEALRSRGLQLRCEPGRSLVDGCGLTAARVEFRKQRRDGTWLIGLAMNRTQCRSTSDDFLVDPLLVQPDPGGSRTAPIEGYLVGAYCIERELLTWRRLRFPHGVAIGDIVVFPNTAGYLMHILESASHQIPLARNLVLGRDGEALARPDRRGARGAGGVKRARAAAGGSPG